MSLYLRIKNRLTLELDSILWCRSVSKIKEHVNCTADKKVLFCNLMTMVATAKVDALYAASLRAKGYQTYVLLMDRAPIIEKIFRAALTDVQFIYLSRYLKEDMREKAKDIITGLTSSEDILSLERNDCRIGKNALSYAVRRLRVGTLDLNDEDHRVVFCEVLAQSLSVSEVAPTLIKELNLDLAVFLERGYTPAGEFFDVCISQEIRTVQWLGGPQSDCLLYKAYKKENHSMHPLALSDEVWERLNKPENWTLEKEQRVMDQLNSHYKSGAWFNRQQLQNGKKIKDSVEILNDLGLDLNKKTAVVFSHIFYDATFFYGDSLYSDYRKWLIETIRYAIENENLNWIVKVHPVNVWRSAADGVQLEQLEAKALQEEFGNLPSHIKIMQADTDVNTFSLFQLADYGLTVRGTIGMEFPCFGIPVITGGSGRYSGRGFTIDPQTIDAYKDILLDLHHIERLNADGIDLARRYAYGTFFLRPLRMDSYVLDFQANTFGSASLKQNTFVDQRTFVNWPKIEDLEKITNWMMSEHEDLSAEKQ